VKNCDSPEPPFGLGDDDDDAAFPGDVGSTSAAGLSSSALTSAREAAAKRDADPEPLEGFPGVSVPRFTPVGLSRSYPGRQCVTAQQTRTRAGTMSPATSWKTACSAGDISRVCKHGGLGEPTHRGRLGGYNQPLRTRGGCGGRGRGNDLLETRHTSTRWHTQGKALQGYQMPCSAHRM
jgi:hypothetical protein